MKINKKQPQLAYFDEGENYQTRSGKPVIQKKGGKSTGSGAKENSASAAGAGNSGQAGPLTVYVPVVFEEDTSRTPSGKTPSYVRTPKSGSGAIGAQRDLNVYDVFQEELFEALNGGDAGTSGAGRHGKAALPPVKGTGGAVRPPHGDVEEALFGVENAGQSGVTGVPWVDSRLAQDAVNRAFQEELFEALNGGDAGTSGAGRHSKAALPPVKGTGGAVRPSHGDVEGSVVRRGKRGSERRQRHTVGGQPFGAGRREPCVPGGAV